MSCASVKRASLRFICAISLLSFSGIALAERHALVMGNAAYKVGRLNNPPNDVQLMSQTLRGIGFTVTPQVNLNRSQMRQQVRDLRSKMRAGDEVIFYFAGHGVQSEGNNYLLPIGHDIRRDHEISDASVSLNFILGELGGVPDTSVIVILDACRDNPFPGSFRTLSRGLTRVEKNSAGILVAFAAATGQVSSDGQGKNGLYTSQLVKHLKTPNITINTMFNRVRKDVYRVSKKAQYPEEKNMLMEDVYLVKKNTPVPNKPITQSDEITVENIAPNKSDNDLPVQKSRLYFPSRSANLSLRAAAEEYFKEVVFWLNQNNKHHVTLTGHTDSLGKAKANLDLGLKRAIKIKSILTKFGANTEQVDIASMGETQPIGSNTTSEGRYRNRRVELIPSIFEK